MKTGIWDMFANIKNGQIIKKKTVLQPKTKLSSEFLNILWEEGFILGYTISKSNVEILEIFLKYKNDRPVINSLKLISKPSRRLYYSASQLWKLNSKNGTIIMSTNKGLMTIKDCKKMRIGGEAFLILK